MRRIRIQYREGDIDRREYQQESALTKAALDATRVSVDDEVVRYGDHIEGLLEAWEAATLEERHQLLSMMLDAVYVDMAQGLVLGLKPKPEFLPLFNLGEPVTTGDSELVTGGMEQSRTTPATRAGSVGGGQYRKYLLQPLCRSSNPKVVRRSTVANKCSISILSPFETSAAGLVKFAFLNNPR